MTNKELARGVARAITPPPKGPSAQARLYACPFCGSTTLRAVKALLDSGDEGNFNIECQVCCAAGPPAGDLEEAGKRWNLRL